MSHLLDRDGVAVYYEVHGATDADATILLTHGYSATSRMWAPQIKPFTERYRLVIWDMRGHGRSASPRDPRLYAEAHVIDDMRAVLDDVGAARAVIGGLSLGGYMSLAFAAAEPARTQALMVFDTGPGYRNDEAREAWNRNARRTADAIDAKGFAGLTTSSAEVAAAQHTDPTGLALAARHMLVQSDGHVIESLAHLGMPALVLVGELDQPFLAASEYMARKIPNVRKVVLEGAGHAANLDRPKGFNAAVLEFLADAVPARTH